MSEELRVEFTVAFSGRRAEVKPVTEPGVKAERLRVDRTARRARNLALAYWIDGLVRSGEVEDLAAVARMCGVSRARVSIIESHILAPLVEQERALATPVMVD